MHERIFNKCSIDCDSELHKTDLILTEGPLLKCSVCGQLLSSCSLEQYEKSMLEFNTEEFYGAGTPSKRDLKNHKKWLDNLIKISKKDHLKILDIGCSSGGFLSTAKNYGFDVTGVEPAKNAAKIAQNKGINVHPCFLNEANFNTQTFDAITIFEVIEHLIDPISVLRECYRILKPGGILLIGTGNAHSWTTRFLKDQWDYFSIKNHGGHINFFNINSIVKIGNLCGFSVKKIKTHGISFANKTDSSTLKYKLLKILSECLACIVKILKSGHQMHVYLGKK